MTINPTIRAKAAYFGVDPALVQAVYQAEGGTEHAILTAVQCSIPSVQTFEKAIEVVCRSAVHAMSDYVKAHDPAAFVESWAKRWAPRGVANDPTNRPSNVKRLWLA
jgi:hypothetical protein